MAERREQQAGLLRIDRRRLLGHGEAKLLLPFRNLPRPEEKDTEVEAHDRGAREGRRERAEKVERGERSCGREARDGRRNERLGRARRETRRRAEEPTRGDDMLQIPRPNSSLELGALLGGNRARLYDDRRQARRNTWMGKRVKRVDGIRRVRVARCHLLPRSSRVEVATGMELRQAEIEENGRIVGIRVRDLLHCGKALRTCPPCERETKASLDGRIPLEDRRRLRRLGVLRVIEKCLPPEQRLRLGVAPEPKLEL